MDSFDKQWQRWFPENRGEKPVSPPQRGHGSKTIIIIATVVVLLIVLSVSKEIYTEWLWFGSLGYSDIYITVLKARVLIFFSAAVLFCSLFLGNLLLAAHLAPSNEIHFWPWTIVVRRLQRISKLGVILATTLLSVNFGLAAQGNWMLVLSFFNRQPFNVADPIFHRDVGFYVFLLPFLDMLRNWIFGALVVTLLGSAALYLLSYTTQRLKFDFARPVLAHVGGLAMAILGLFAWSYWLGIWELVFSKRGVVFGASYADIHAKLPAQWILLVVVLICMVVIMVSILRRRFRWSLYAVVGWIALTIIVGQIFPALVQRFQVQPNELGKERPYIEYNIQSTREAFGLNYVEEQSFPAEKLPDVQDVVQNEVTINNIRLWDHRPLKDTYNQLQAIRLYYDFNDVDVDRYIVDGEYRQVMLSARELSAEKLAEEAQTWVNRRLQFTHGYGIAMSPVNEVSTEGLPILLVKDIPPVTNVTDFIIERPQIYFGEKTNSYVIVNAKTQEFDYPMGEENVYGHYEGKDGVNIGSFIRRIAYAWQFGDLNILISSEVTSESRIMYYRNIRDRVRHLAPFLELDSDPYIVVVDGRLLWIQDAYTTTARYPYSEPFEGGINYIRNSVKAVIDAYDGTTTFYVTDSEDALIQTYQAIFPKLFVPVEQMPQSLRVHLRYPEGMFNIQSSVYQSYHMRDARVFYNREDMWAVPKEVYAGSEQEMEAYYIIMRLPEEEKEEFLLILPFTPVNKNNTIGWLAGRCDDENYGKLLAYHFPKERLVYGPSQIENRIQQDTVITEQLALWGRGGSRVIRGNLLVIPLGKSNLYVESVFLQADTGGLPELKRVIVAAGDHIAMERTLSESLAAIFGTGALPIEPEIEPPTPAGPEEPVVADVANLIEGAQQHYDKALEYLKAGDWANYGKEIDALKMVLDKLSTLVTEEE